MKKRKILKELEDVRRAVEEEATKTPLSYSGKSIRIPIGVVESLLITQSNSNWAAVALVCQEIREAAQEQMPEVFKK